MSESSTEFVVTGDFISSHYTDPIIGHGVIAQKHGDETRYIATVSGTVHRINKLITVRPKLKRYMPEIGDVVVGRVTDIVDKRWRLDINARQAGILNIASINLPGSQRRRTDEDVLQMRSILKESDIVSAEVQKVGTVDKAAQLHTRSHRYGKLLFGMMVTCSAHLLVRAKQHFHHLESLGIELILGVNGNIWIGPYESDDIKKKRLQGDDVDDDDETPVSQEFDQSLVTDEMLESMARIRNAIKLLDTTNNLITLDSILYIYNESVESGLNAYEMIHPNYILHLTQHVKFHAVRSE